MSTIQPVIQNELLTKFNEVYKELTYNIRINLAFKHKVPIKNITSIKFESSSIHDDPIYSIEYFYTSRSGERYRNGASGNSLALLAMKPDATMLAAMNSLTTQKQAIQAELLNLENENQSLDLKSIADRKIEIRKHQEYLQMQLKGLDTETEKLFNQIEQVQEQLKANETDR